MRLVFDIETDGIEATQVWCIVAKDVDTGVIYKFSDYDDKCLSLSDGYVLLDKADA